ncbi:MAG: hypothetical protein N2595_00365 [bacterium]|nr:hypothetical protein [bacterium]
MFEPATAFLRQICYDSTELVHGVYAAVRGPHWETISPHVEKFAVRYSEGATMISFHVVCKALPIWLEWDGKVVASHAGTITFSFDGVARSTFLRNRIGLCVLHPDTCAGLPCVIEHSDGSVTHTMFPYLISPHQPFLNVRAISYRTKDGVETRIACEGDVFETEDQRNWTDASFKTYCTPLASPSPVRVTEGTRIRQSVTIMVRARDNKRVSRPQKLSDAVVCEITQRPRPRPEIGFGVPWENAQFNDVTCARLQALKPAHLRTELHLSDKNWRKDWTHALNAAQTLATLLEVALVVPSSLDDLEEFAAEWKDNISLVARCFVLGEGRTVLSREVFSRAADYLRSRIAQALIGAGTNRYFTELNRSRPPLEGVDAITYSCNPQVHTFDNASIAETPAGQAWTVRTARSFCGVLPIFVSPITLRPRPARHAFETNEYPPAWADVRQASLFAVGFALSSLTHLAAAGVAGITLFDIVGWNGIMDGVYGGWLSHLCGQHGVYPLYHLCADLAENACATWLEADVSEPIRLAALALTNHRRTVLLLSNLTADELAIAVRVPGTYAHARRLDASTLPQALLSPENFRAGYTDVFTPHDGRVELVLQSNAYLRLDTYTQEPLLPN